VLFEILVRLASGKDVNLAVFADDAADALLRTGYALGLAGKEVDSVLNIRSEEDDYCEPG